MTALMAAIIFVESGGDPEAVGDGGRSRGLMQMSMAAYADACEQLSREGQPVPESYMDAVKTRSWCETLFRAYMRRYVPKSYDTRNYEIMARTWNGGPRGATKRSTLPYWNKVKAAMERGEQ